MLDMASCRRWIGEHAHDGLLATSVADIRTAKETGREAIIFGPQNTEFIGTDLGRFEAAYEMGVRILQLTYQRQNWVGSGCGERRDGGLSTFGRALRPRDGRARGRRRPVALRPSDLVRRHERVAQPGDPDPRPSRVP